MLAHLKLGTATAAAFILTACASTTDPKFYVDTDQDADRFAATNSDVELPDEMQFGINDDDEFEARTVATTNTAVAGRVIMVDRTIADGAADLNDYSTVYGAIGQAGLVATFDGEEEYTVFAPNNAAFSGMDLSGLSQAQLQNTLKYHTVAGSISSSDLQKKLAMNNGTYEVETLNGDTLRFIDMDGTIKVADSNGYTYNITAADNEYSNGYIHGIDGVLGRTY